MDVWTLALVWLASIAVATLLAALHPKTVWWVGTITAVPFGPLGIAAVAVDIATNKSNLS